MFSVRKTSFIALLCLIALLISPIGNAKAALSDGTYSINYTVISPDDESVSIANDYFVKPAKLIVENGKIQAQITLKNSKWITEFQGQNGGNNVISSNEGADTRVVQFNVGNLSSPQASSIRVDIDDMNYHHDYTVRFQFDESSLSLISASAKQADSDKKNAGAGQQTDNTGEAVSNPQTSDTAATALYGLLLVASLFLVVKRFKKIRA